MKTGIKKKKTMHTGKIGRNAAKITQHLTCFKAFMLLIIIDVITQFWVIPQNSLFLNKNKKK
jgi:hypothetical protein